MPRRLMGLALVVIGAGGCKPSDVLSVPPPATTVGSGYVRDVKTAETFYDGAKVTLFAGLGGDNASLIQLSSVLGDELAWSALGYSSNIDARYTSQTELPQFSEPENPLIALLAAHSSLLLSVEKLRRYEPASGQSKVGEAYALIGYAELFLAEDYCAGVTLSQVLAEGGFVYGKPLTTDSLLAMAESHFDSAQADAHGNDIVMALASVGLGRTRLDRGHFALAATAVANVPIDFVYNAQFALTYAANAGTIDLYESFLPTNGSDCPQWNVADRDGGNGLNFVSAHDARLVLDSTLKQTCDGQYHGVVPGAWYYPTKFGDPTSTGLIPVATGVEARLIAAEAALKAGDAATWAADLNGLRAAAPSTYLRLASGLGVLSQDSTTTASAAEQVDVMFRERAFWLFGTGTRLGDLRRLIRQYGRAPNAVFPSGPYPNGHDPSLPLPLPNYGPDVSLTLPTPASQTSVTNPYYKGCIAPTTTA